MLGIELAMPPIGRATRNKVPVISGIDQDYGYTVLKKDVMRT
jgi:hypothetical protein